MKAIILSRPPLARCTAPSPIFVSNSDGPLALDRHRHENLWVKKPRSTRCCCANRMVQTGVLNDPLMVDNVENSGPGMRAATDCSAMRGLRADKRGASRTAKLHGWVGYCAMWQAPCIVVYFKAPAVSPATIFLCSNRNIAKSGTTNKLENAIT